MVNLCRASFAVDCILAPIDDYPLENGPEEFDFDRLETERADELAKVDRTLMHDAVLNIAMVWKDTWSALL